MEIHEPAPVDGGLRQVREGRERLLTAIDTLVEQACERGRFPESVVIGQIKGLLKQPEYAADATAAYGKSDARLVWRRYAHARRPQWYEQDGQDLLFKVNTLIELRNGDWSTGGHCNKADFTEFYELVQERFAQGKRLFK